MRPSNTLRCAALTHAPANLALLVSFVAMSTSGLLMFFIEGPSFAPQIHPGIALFRGSTSFLHDCDPT